MASRPGEGQRAGRAGRAQDGRGPGGQLPRGLVVEPMEEAGRRRLGRRVQLLYRPRLGLGDPAAMRTVVTAFAPAALVVGNHTRVTGALLDAAPDLRVVGRLGSGVDNIDVEAARARGVAVVTASGSGAPAVAEMVFAYLFGVVRPLAPADADVRAGGWQRDAFAGSELWRRRLGIVGLGEIGTRVARRARAFGMSIVAHDPRRGAHDGAFEELGVARTDLDRLLAESDFVSIHTPLTAATRGLLDARALARLRPSAHLIVTARGGIVDEAALADALRGGRLAGALLDVRAVEPPPHPDPLADVPRLVLTPHMAGRTAEARVRTALAIADGVAGVLARGR